MIGRISLLACLVLAVAASAADEETRLRFQKDVVRGAAAGDEILAVPLDDDVHAAVRDGFPVMLMEEAKLPQGVASLDEMKRQYKRTPSA